MRYTPAQIKEALELSDETLRHWRKALPPLQAKRGYAPCFAPGDLLALAVVAKFHKLGISVSRLQAHAQALFIACSRAAWFGLEDKVIVFDGDSLSMVAPDAEGNWLREVRVTAPLGPIIRELRQRLSEEEPYLSQREIAFPPVGVTHGRSA